MLPFSHRIKNVLKPLKKFNLKRTDKRKRDSNLNESSMDVTINKSKQIKSNGCHANLLMLSLNTNQKHKKGKIVQIDVS